MSDVKSKFTLHTEYKDFVPGQSESEIAIEALSPHLVRSTGCVVSLIAIFISLSFGLCMGAAALAFVVMDQQYAREGQPVTAVVTSCRMEREGKSGHLPGIFYTYAVSDMVYEGHDRMQGNCDDYPAGKTLEAIYLASSPTSSRIVQAGTERSSETVIMVGSMFLGTLFFLYFAWTTLRQVRRYLYARSKRRSLATNGMLLEGEITAINGHKPYKHDAYYVRIWYTFETPRKKILKGFAEAHRQDLKDKLPPVGTPVTVLYAADASHMML